MEGSSDNWTAPIVTALLVAVFIEFLVKVFRRKEKYMLPSGPRGLPLIGNVHSLVRTPFQFKLAEWAGQFGDVYTIHFGPKPAIVVNDVGKMKEIFGIFPASTGKLLTDTFVIPFLGKNGILCLEGDKWAEQRQFCVKNLRTFGLGKGSTMEPMIVEEVKDLMVWLENEGAGYRPVHVFKNLQKATFNALWTLVTGEKIALGDNRFSDIMENIFNSIQNSVNTGLVVLPWLKHVAPERSGFNWLLKASLDAHQFLSEYFKEHESSFQEDSPRDLMDAFIEQLRKEQDPGSTFYGEKGRKHAIGTLITLFLGGGETTASTMTWLIFYLCSHRQVQRKLQEEYDRVVGQDRDPNLKDKLNMPYTDSVIMETMRKSSFFPIGVPHELTEDTHFYEYYIPKGTILIANMYHTHANQQIWGDPDKFRPERFLTGDKALKENVVGFQMGKRQCLGEGFARDTMFLFSTKLLQKFEFRADPSADVKEYLEPKMGIFLSPKPLPVIITPMLKP